MTQIRFDHVLALLGELHQYKDAAYGDAWRRRGEVIAIFANLARKYDRLTIAIDEPEPARTEPLGDTVGDLCVYAAKYLSWLAETQSLEFDRAAIGVGANAASAALGAQAITAVFGAIAADTGREPPARPASWAEVRSSFSLLEQGLMAQASAQPDPAALLSSEEKVRVAYALARANAQLLWRLACDDAQQLDGLRREVERMRRG